MDITGVVDDRVIGGYFSVWALSQAHIVNLDEVVEVENVTEHLDIYPNPTAGVIYFESQLENVAIYDIAGRQVYVQSHAEQSINLSLLNAGTYVLTAQSNGENIIAKIMITE